MEDQIQRLAEKTWKVFKDIDASRRYLIAVVGIPGSGKTTAAKRIVNQLNAFHHSDFEQKWPNSPRHQSNHSHPSHPDVATSIPLDGFHLPRSALSAMPDPKEAHYRRGAAFTFDPKAYLSLVAKLRQPIEAGTRTIHAPSFDHAIKDPVPNDIHIPPTSRIVVLEGLYTALDQPMWRDAAEEMDEIWLIDVDIDVAKQRVAERNFKAGLSPTFEAALERTENNDMRNAREILADMVPRINETIQSIDDPAWKDKGLNASADDGESGSSAGRPGISADKAQRRPSQAVVDEDEERPGPRERMDSIAELTAAGAGM